jgi:molybdopterin synthase catalytic subunit
VIDQWIAEIKKTCPPERLGMLLVHNGVVRASSKEGKPVRGMRLSYDRAALDELVRRMRATQGIADIRVWINEGEPFPYGYFPCFSRADHTDKNTDRS